MKRIFFLSIIPAVLATPLANAQHFQLRGLEIYNLYYHNPAYLQAEKNFQLDFIGFNSFRQTGIWTSVMTTIPKFNSSAGIRFAQGSLVGSADYWDLQLAYAYKHTFSKNFHLNGGMQFNSGHADYGDTFYEPDRDVLKKRHNGYLGLGIALEYHKLHAGISTSFPLYLRKEVLHVDNTTETQKDDAGITNFNFQTGYSLGKSGRLTFDPIFGLDYRILNSGRTKQLKGYLGANLVIRNWLGFGFTMGNLTSFSTSLNIMNRVTLMIGIYAGGNELFGPLDYANYTIGSMGFEIIGQIRVNL